MFKKTIYIMACAVVIITDNCCNAFRKGMFVDNIQIVEITTVED
jgi:hypothetical protein